MDALTNEKCTACRRDSPRATEAEVRELKPQIPEWTLLEREGIERLERVLSVRKFAEALSFTESRRRAGRGGRPSSSDTNRMGRVTVTLWTHKIRGLHRNDFIIAAKIDSLVP